jgi:putative transposase
LSDGQANPWTLELPAAAKQSALERAIERRKTGEKLPRRHAKALADAFDCDIATVYRAVARGHFGRKRTERRRLSDEERVELARCGGNIAEMARRRQQADPGAPSLRTFRRITDKTFNAAELAFLRKGDNEMRKKQLYVPAIIEQRNAVWQMDIVYTPLHLALKSGSGAITRVVECTVVDGATRRVLANVVEASAPNSRLTLATLAVALSRFGAPELLVIDNGPEFLSTEFTKVGAAFGFDVQPARPYSPQQKGRVERFFWTKEQEFLRGLPYYLHGPRDLAGEIYGAESERLTVKTYREKSDAWVAHYNDERGHSALGGLTPSAVWERDETPLRQVEEQELWWLLPPDPKPRSVYGFGVLFDNEKYFALPLVERFGERLEVRAMPNERDRIWLVQDDELVCIAKRWTDQPPAVVRAAIAHRDSEQEQMQELLAQADTPATDGATAAVQLDEELLQQLLRAVQEDREAAELRDLAQTPVEDKAATPSRTRFSNLNRPVNLTEQRETE